MTSSVLARSKALWNRSSLDLRSDETLAQILDRGSVEDFRALYGIAAGDAELRRRIHCIVLRVPLPMAHFWLAALESLGEVVDYDCDLPNYADRSGL